MDNSLPGGVRALPLRDGKTLDPQQTFATFVVGSCNRFAYAACKAVAEGGDGRYSPLFIHGPRGVGKTHLATAVAHAALERRPETRIAQLSADTFMRGLVMALRHDRAESFRHRVRDVDLLIVDDVQLLAGRRRTQEEFFHAFNALHDLDRQIVLTCDRPPKAIPRLEERLCNRFEWGLVVQLQPLDLDTRVALLERDAASGAVRLPRDVSAFLAEETEGAGVRELDALAARTRRRAAVTRRRLTVELAREALADVARDGDVGVEAITRAVCEAFALPPGELRSRRRTKSVAVPRQLAMYLCRRLTKASYPQIGQLFGRDHSTVMHATEATERRRKTDSAFHATVESLEQRIRGH